MTQTSALPAPGSIGAWWLAARPRTLPVAIAPVVVGAALAAHAGRGIDVIAVVAALLGAILLQIGANLANDAFDFEKGTDDERRIGPPRAAQAGLLTPATLKRGMAVVFVLASLCGVFLTFRYGIVIVAIGAASIASAMAYTGGPYPLGYNGLGDIFVFVFFGPVAVCGTFFVATAALAPIAFVAAGVLPNTVLVALATVPRIVRLGMAIGRETEGAALTTVLADTAALLVVWAGLFAAGVGMGAE